MSDYNQVVELEFDCEPDVSLNNLVCNQILSVNMSVMLSGIIRLLNAILTILIDEIIQRCSGMSVVSEL